MTHYAVKACTQYSVHTCETGFGQVDVRDFELVFLPDRVEHLDVLVQLLLFKVQALQEKNTVTLNRIPSKP